MSHLYLLAPVFLLSALASAGCSMHAGAQGEAIDADARALLTTTVAAGTDLTKPPEARLYFDPGWNQSLYETAYAGGKVRIIAAPDRFPLCGVDGKVTANVRLDGGKTIVVSMTKDSNGWTSGSLELPVSTASFEVWLRSEKGACVEYDSAFGKNYRFDARGWKPTVVHFNADWTEQAPGPIASDGVLVIDYDPARLPNCRATDKYGLPAWDIVAHVRLSNGQQVAQTVVFGEAQYGAVHEKTKGLALIPLPGGIDRVQLWFENITGEVNYSPAPQCHEWDSDFGKNYTFALTASSK